MTAKVAIALVIATSTTSLSAADNRKQLLCQADLPTKPFHRDGWVNMNVYADTNEIAEANLFLPMDEPFYELQWDVDRGQFGKARTFHFQMEFDHSIDSPYSIDIYLDGKLAHQEKLLKTVDRAGYTIQNGLTYPPTYTGLVGMGYYGQFEPPIDIARHKVMRAVAHYPDGSKIGELTVKLPDWRALRTRVRIAYDQAERARKARQCADATPVD